MSKPRPMAKSRDLKLEQGSYTLACYDIDAILKPGLFRIKICFKDYSGRPLKNVEANEGDDILSVAHEHNIDLEGQSLLGTRSLSTIRSYAASLGACEGSIACSTCHVIIPKEYYHPLPEPSDDENDMLDMAFGLTETSRLGCQVRLSF